MNILNIKYGLFNRPFLTHPIIWLKDWRIYRKRRKFLLKHGYSPVCQWEYSETILALSKEIFTFMRNERQSNIPFPQGNEETWGEMNDKFYDELLLDIKKMEDDADNDAKRHFFNRISKYFWTLWD